MAGGVTAATGGARFLSRVPLLLMDTVIVVGGWGSVAAVVVFAADAVVVSDASLIFPVCFVMFLHF